MYNKFIILLKGGSIQQRYEVQNVLSNQGKVFHLNCITPYVSLMKSVGYLGSSDEYPVEVLQKLQDVLEDNTKLMHKYLQKNYKKFLRSDALFLVVFCAENLDRLELNESVFENKAFLMDIVIGGAGESSLGGDYVIYTDEDGKGLAVVTQKLIQQIISDSVYELQGSVYEEEDIKQEEIDYDYTEELKDSKQYHFKLKQVLPILAGIALACGVAGLLGLCKRNK